jgi:hypothetical protein
LGRWLGEAYRVPVDPDPDEEESIEPEGFNGNAAHHDPS